MNSEIRFEKTHENINVRVRETKKADDKYHYDWMIHYDGAQFLDGHSEDTNHKLSDYEIKRVIEKLRDYKVNKMYKQLNLWNKVDEVLK